MNEVSLSSYGNNLKVSVVDDKNSNFPAKLLFGEARSYQCALNSFATLKDFPLKL